MLRLFTVQSKTDVARLRNGGSPWPAGLQRANLGQGLYAWESHGDALGYRNLLSAHGAKDLDILEFKVADVDFATFSSCDLTLLSDDDVNDWMAQFSQYGQGLPHGFEHVIRNTDRGKEHYFSASVFARLTEVP
jgi:hypothetical protein